VCRWLTISSSASAPVASAMFVELSCLAGRVIRAGVSSSLGLRLFFMPLFTGSAWKWNSPKFVEVDLKVPYLLLLRL
jgi:hypothetical protein